MNNFNPKKVGEEYKARLAWIRRFAELMPMICEEAEKAGVPMPDRMGLGDLRWVINNDGYWHEDAAISVIMGFGEDRYSSRISFTVRGAHRGRLFVDEVSDPSKAREVISGFFAALRKAFDGHKQFVYMTAKERKAVKP